jgi:hypothetical protein
MPATNVVPNRNGNPTPLAARQIFVHSRVNHVTVDEAQEAPDVVLGTFSVNSTVMFDFGALCSFISVLYVEKHNVPIAMLKCPMVVSPWRRYACKACVLEGENYFKGVEVSANLIVLDSKVTYVILGMDSMSKQKDLIDYTKKLIKLTTEV